MGRLARPTSGLRSHYDAVVVGSGYGGGVAACRLARLGMRTAVLERGREVLPGEFPATADGLAQEVEWVAGGVRRGNRSGVFSIDVGGDLALLGGVGLGGGSLVGAGVAVNPDMLVLEDGRWPTTLRTDHWLSLGFKLARGMLSPSPMPPAMPSRRHEALRGLAAALGREVERVPLHIAFAAGAAGGGPVCNGCGNCLSGCNLGAKTTVRSTYLAAAAAAGAELFTGAVVRYVEPVPGHGWRIVLVARDAVGRAVPLRAVTAGLVVLAAGTLGTAEILLRSRERGLAVSDTLGRRVSLERERLVVGSGGRLGGAFGVPEPVASGAAPPGPSVTGMIDLRRRRDPRERIVIMDVGVPEAARGLVTGLADAGASSAGGTGVLPAASAASAAGGPRADRLMALGLFGEDAAEGEIVAAGDGVRLVWPGRDDGALEQRAAEIAAMLLTAGGAGLDARLSGAVVRGLRAVTSPTGGAAMGEGRDSGVVDHRCRVFDATPGRPPDAVHAGLYVVDAAVLPRPLGVPPALTVAAIAERAMLLVARDLGRAVPAETAARTAAAAPVNAGPPTTNPPVAASAAAGQGGSRTLERA